jgi:hypothetical protein
MSVPSSLEKVSTTTSYTISMAYAMLASPRA